MWFFSSRDRACRGFEAPLEDYLESLENRPGARPGAALAAHLAACPECLTALDEALAASVLVREAAIPVPASLAADPYFAKRVSARIREHAARPSEFWPQLETASIRLMAGALSLAILLGALSASGVTRTAQPTMARLRPADPRAISPEMNAPVNPDDVVVALLSNEHGRQR
jgi:hypothetical protein